MNSLEERPLFPADSPGPHSVPNEPTNGALPCSLLGSEGLHCKSHLSMPFPPLNDEVRAHIVYTLLPFIILHVENHNAVSVK